MNKKFYPVTIIKKDNLFIASIVELGISVKGKSHLEALESCIFEKDKTIKMLDEKKIPLPNVYDDYSLKTTKKIFLFFIKSISSAVIFLITFLILIVMFSPYIKAYLNSDYAQEHFNKASKKFGISFCIEKKCKQSNE